MKKFFLIFCLFTSMFAQSFKTYETKIPTTVQNEMLKIMISPTISMNGSVYCGGLNVVIAVSGNETDYLFNDNGKLQLRLFTDKKTHVFDGMLVRRKIDPVYGYYVYFYNFLSDTANWSNIRKSNKLGLQLKMTQLNEHFNVNVQDFRKNIDVLVDNFVQNKTSNRVDF